MTDVAIDILSLRESLGWSQSRMAAYLGVDRSTVTRIEGGQTQSGPIRRLLANLKDAQEKGTVALVAPDPATAQSTAEMTQ